MTTLTLTGGQISPIIEIGKGTRVTSSGNGTIEYYPGSLADAKNGGTFETWPKGTAAGSVDAIRGMCIRATATGAMTVTLEEGKNDLSADGAYWDSEYATFSTDANNNTVLVGADGQTYNTSRVSNGVVIFGDSRTERSNYAGGDRGLWTFANAIMGQRFKLLANAGVGGNTTAQMLARIDADVLAYNPAFVTVLGGTNDIANGVPATTVISNLQAIYQKIRNTGATVIACTEYPASGVYGTTAKREALQQINRAIIADVQSHDNMVLANLFNVILDPASATGDQLAGTLHDNIHLSTYGCILGGGELASVMEPLVPPQRVIGTSLVDVISATHPGGNLVVNGNMSGGAGGVSGVGMSSAGGVGVADTWALQLETGTATAVGSKVARTDGIPGELQRITINAVTAANTVVRLRQLPVLPAQITPGDFVEAYAELALSGVVGQVDTLHLMIQFQDVASATTGTAYAMLPNNYGHQAWSGVVKLDAFEVPAGTTKCVAAVRCQLDTGAEAIVDVGEVEVRKVI